eukprot:7390827-Prymnesium_polylepis.1
MRSAISSTWLLALCAGFRRTVGWRVRYRAARFTLTVSHNSHLSPLNSQTVHSSHARYCRLPSPAVVPMVGRRVSAPTAARSMSRAVWMIHRRIHYIWRHSVCLLWLGVGRLSDSEGVWPPSASICAVGAPMLALEFCTDIGIRRE